jgi:hypothetical protein
MVSGEENTFFLRAFEALGIMLASYRCILATSQTPNRSRRFALDSLLEGAGFEPSVPL